jgi:hypothetical protein
MADNKAIICDIKHKNQKSMVETEGYKSTSDKYEYPCGVVAGLNQQVKPYFDAEPVADHSLDWVLIC